MKVGIFTDAYFPTVNGVTNQIANFKKAMEQRGHEVHIFCPTYKNYTYNEPNIHTFPTIISTKFVEGIFNVNFQGMITTPKLRPYTKLIQTLDIIHVHVVFIIGKYGVKCGKRFNIPIVYTNHTNYEQLEQAAPLALLTHLYYQRMLQAFAKKCDAVVCPSDVIAKQLHNYYHIKKHIEVIPNGIFTNKFKNIDSKDLKQQLSISKDDIVLLYAGRLSKEKNLFFLAQTLIPVLQKRRNVKLVYVGDGPMREPVTTLIKEHSLSDQFVCTGFVPYEKIPSYFGLADIFLSASLSEVNPLSIIEAQAAGLPVVAIESPGMTEIVVSQKGGFITKNDPGEFRMRTQQLIDDKKLRIHMSQSAQEKAEEFSIETCAKQHETLYNSLLVKK